MNYILAPSILAADFLRLGEEIREVTEAGARYLHIDVMDGHFVPSISFGMPVIKSIRSAADCVFDVHLMIERPDRYIADFVTCGADSITVHAETCVHLDRTLGMIREQGIRCGVTLNPATPLSVLEYVLDKIDMVLLMSVNPGFGGQQYIPYMTEKIAALRRMIRDRGLDVDIQVDGGVSLENLPMILDAGANVIVAGSSIFGANTGENARAFMDVLTQYEVKVE